MNDFLSDNQTFIFSLLGVVVFVLATYLGFLFNKIRVQKKIISLRQKELEKFRQEREESIRESIQILARAVVNKQCEISEGCLRITKLMEIIDIGFTPETKAIEHLYDQIKHFPVLEERNQLPKQEKFNQDKQRFAIENENETQVYDACQALLNNFKQ